ncbi:MAG: diacylglycerol kinase [Parvibaculales bacterium]
MDEYKFSDNPHKGNTGIKRAWFALLNSLSGFQFAWREESAIRQEFIAACLLVPLAVLLPVTLIEKILMIFSVVLVFIIELLNSSVEAAVDRISLEKHGLSKRAKDYGSAAVMLAMCLVAMVYGLVLLNYFNIL